MTPDQKEAAEIAERGYSLAVRDGKTHVTLTRERLRTILDALAASQPAPSADNEGLVEWAEVGMNLFADLLQEVGDLEVELIDGEGPDAIRENYRRVIRAALAASQPAPKYREQPTHHVHRGPDSLPCHCWADNDHPIGQEVAAPAADTEREIALFDRDGLAKDIRMQAAERGLTMKQAAAEIGVSHSTLCRVANLGKEPNVEGYLRIQQWLKPAADTGQAVDEVEALRKTLYGFTQGNGDFMEARRLLGDRTYTYPAPLDAERDMDETPTPYGVVMGPAVAVSYIRELVSDDTNPEAIFASERAALRQKEGEA